MPGNMGDEILAKIEVAQTRSSSNQTENDVICHLCVTSFSFPTTIFEP